jgi:hypothetical protein
MPKSVDIKSTRKYDSTKLETNRRQVGENGYHEKREGVDKAYNPKPNETHCLLSRNRAA